MGFLFGKNTRRKQTSFCLFLQENSDIPCFSLLVCLVVPLLVTSQDRGSLQRKCLDEAAVSRGTVHHPTYVVPSTLYKSSMSYSMRTNYHSIDSKKECDKEKAIDN